MATRPAKRARLLSDTSSSGSDGEDGGTPVIKVNEDYRKRFEHNKTREERQRLEEKYGKDANLDEAESESTSESEDDEGILATYDLDDEIFSTLNAIRSKDPRIYDKSSAFYRPIEETTTATANVTTAEKRKEKPIHLRDYHRQNLLEEVANGDGNFVEEEQETVPLSYDAEQAAMKRDLVAQMHAGGTQTSNSKDADDNDAEEFLVKKLETEPVPARAKASARSRPVAKVSLNTDADPDTFLTDFLTSRAWVPNGTSRFEAFESEDESDLERAEAFEEAYNLRFENPAHANEKLITHSREAAAKYSVRREEITGRQKARERERARKDVEKAERDQDKARLRRLRLDEAREKLARFREAAGLDPGVAMSAEAWEKFLDKGFDSADWEQEMAKTFGDDYYAAGEANADFAPEEEEEDIDEEEVVPMGQHVKKLQKRPLKKPKWDDDIDIGDIVPEFDEEEELRKGQITLTDDEADEGDAEDTENDAVTNGVGLPSNSTDLDIINRPTATTTKPTSRNARSRTARLDRAALEQVIETSLPEATLRTTTTDNISVTAPFRYRATSPTTFGLGPLDILLADDTSLNNFAGLKKLAAFRDEGKKSRDRKKLGKKARLRKWREETFGKGAAEGFVGETGEKKWEEWWGKARGFAGDEGQREGYETFEVGRERGFGEENREKRKAEVSGNARGKLVAANEDEGRKKKRSKKRKTKA